MNSNNKSMILFTQITQLCLLFVNYIILMHFIVFKVDRNYTNGMHVDAITAGKSFKLMEIEGGKYTLLWRI